MNIDIYDTYITTTDGQKLHFDLLLPSDNSKHAAQYAHQWLHSHGIAIQQISQQSCNFCHSEIANPEVQQLIKRNGYYVLPLGDYPIAATR